MTAPLRCSGSNVIFPPEPFRVFLSHIIFPSVFTSHSASNSRVSEVSTIILTFRMMSGKQWMAVENVVFFSKRSIVITGNLIMMLRVKRNFFSRAISSTSDITFSLSIYVTQCIQQQSVPSFKNCSCVFFMMSEAR